VRDAVSKELEKLRVAGDIGSSLDAEVDLYADEHTRNVLQAIGEELRFVLITSYVRIHDADSAPAEAVPATVPNLSFSIRVTPSAFTKCIRCWHHREDVGTDAAHPQICSRCVENVSGAGEQRRFA
jgi:isoleucyl-tRNA synthetase